MSKLFTIDYRDILKGLALAIGAAMITAISANPTPAFADLILVAKAAGISYIAKNFLTNSDNQFGRKENTDPKPVTPPVQQAPFVVTK